MVHGFQRLRFALEKWGAEVKPSLPATRGRATPRDKAPDTGIATRIGTLRDEYGLTLDMICSELSQELGQNIPLSTLYAWASGSLPRRIPIPRIEQVLDSLMERHVRYDEGAWVEREEVQATILGWLQHLSKKQLSVAADESLAVIESWSVGRHRVMRPKWNRVVENVHDVLRLLGKLEGAYPSRTAAAADDESAERTD